MSEESPVVMLDDAPDTRVLGAEHSKRIVGVDRYSAEADLGGQDADPGLHVPEAGLLFDDMTSETGTAKILESLREELDDSEMQHIARLYGRVVALNDESRKSDDQNIIRQKDTMIKRIEADMVRLFGVSKVERFKDIRYMLRQYDQNNNLFICGEGSAEMAAPFLDEALAYTPDDGQQRFVDEDALSPIGRDMITINLPSGCEPFQIPMSAIVSAAGFESWEGRGTEASAAKIADYASRVTDIPPIKDQLFAYILPDGKIMYASANSHRVAAAIKKGQLSIGFTGTLYVTRLDEYPLRLKGKSSKLYN